MYVCVCVCVMLLLLFRSIQHVTPSGLLRSFVRRIYFFFFFFRTYFEDIFVRHLMHNKQNLQTFYFIGKRKKKQKIHPKNRHSIILSTHETEKSFDWLVATELHLSISLLRRRLLLLLHREEARISGVE